MPILISSLLVLLFSAGTAANADVPSWLGRDWTETDFDKRTIDLDELEPGGPPKDGIKSIDAPTFARLEGGSVRGWAAQLKDSEPVIALSIGGDARAYPLGIMIRHEIVNDVVGGEPVAVTYCPLCNAALVFSRVVGNRVLTFGVSGLLRKADLVMFDRQTESLWQQFEGRAVVGELAGTQLRFLPARLESFGRFRDRFPDGKIMIPENPERRDYLSNPYRDYDLPGGFSPFYGGPLPDGIEPMARVVAVVTEDRAEAWSLTLLRLEGQIEAGDLRLTWTSGQNTALGAERIAKGRDIGNVVVERRTATGWEDVPYHLVFAFSFHAFEPESPIHHVTNRRP